MYLIFYRYDIVTVLYSFFWGHLTQGGGEEMKKVVIAFGLAVLVAGWGREAGALDCAAFNSQSMCEEAQVCVWQDNSCAAAVIESPGSDIAAAIDAPPATPRDKVAVPIPRGALMATQRDKVADPLAGTKYIQIPAEPSVASPFNEIDPTDPATFRVFLEISPRSNEKVQGVQTVTVKLLDGEAYYKSLEVTIGDRKPQIFDKPARITSIPWDTRDDPNGSIEIEATAHGIYGVIEGIYNSFPRVANPVLASERPIP